MESFSTAFRNLLFSSFLSFFSSPSIRRKGSRSRGTVTSSDSVGRHQSDRGTGRENRSAVLHTAKPLFYFAGPNSVALIHPLYMILPFLLFPPSLSLPIFLLFLFRHARPVNPQDGKKLGMNRSNHRSTMFAQLG